jgi:PadR family transcriptional regulator PadR
VERNLGELEQLVMLALARLGDEAYGIAARDEIEARTGRAPAFGTIYTTLARLEEKGLTRSFLGEALATRGGRARKHFVLTASGRAALKRSLTDLRTMTRGLDRSWSAP